MNYSKKIWYLFAAAAFVFVLTFDSSAQDRPRIVKSISSQPINQPQPPKQNPVSTSVQSRPTTQRPPLTQDIQVARPVESESLVKKTVSSSSAITAIVASRSIFDRTTTNSMQRSIFSKLGIPYLYGSTGPNRYDCSGFVWAVFNEAGINFTRQSARSLWGMSTPVEGDERFRFGTLVFLNGLGHMGIVADENGFYHASSSKGITYSPFKGYWESRIVGFRRLNAGEGEIAPTTSDK